MKINNLVDGKILMNEGGERKLTACGVKNCSIIDKILFQNVIISISRII
jgi:hypothetical protein